MSNKTEHIALASTSLCTGCAACSNACPKNCISMKYNIEGFEEPSIDKGTCIKCHKCEMVCPVLSHSCGSDVAKAYTTQTANGEALMKSSSGGAFYEIAKFVIAKDGVVFGVRFDGFHVQHDYAETMEGVEAFMGSKYVQSDVRYSYQQAMNFLKLDRWVLFTGTPCQIAGLKKYLGKSYNKLVTVDVICHGVPSPRVWERYAEGLAKELNVKESRSIRFRYKPNTTDKVNYNYYYYYSGQDNKEHEFVEARKDNLFFSFFSRHIFRESCYQCVYRNTDKTVADITIGDAVNGNQIEKHDGVVSTIISHTDRGESVLKEIREHFNVWEQLDLNDLEAYYEGERRTEMDDNRRINRRLSNVLANIMPLQIVKPIYMKDKLGIILKRKIKKYVKKI